MPTIAMFNGIVIYMYWADHGVPHLHAIRGDQEAVFAIPTGELLEGEVSRRTRRLVTAWIELRRPALLENWRRGQIGVPFEKVPGPEDDA